MSAIIKGVLTKMHGSHIASVSLSVAYLGQRKNDKHGNFDNLTSVTQCT